MNIEQEAAQITREAAQVLAERGHCKGTFHDEQGRVCLWGAIESARRAHEELWLTDLGPALAGQRMRRIAKVLRLAVAHRIELDAPSYHYPGTAYAYPGADWNDARGREGAEVQKLLLAVSDDLEVQ